jgi:DNA-binding response OmpR family regulator
VESAEVLIVEDDELIGSSLCRALSASTYVARHVTTLQGARQAVAARLPQLVLLDVTLPDGDGIDYCAELTSEFPHLPIVMLTARTDEAAVVGALRRGAVDYVAKPFRLAELLARVDRHLQLAARTSVGDARSDVLKVGELTIEPASRRVTWEGAAIDLRPREFELLRRLAVDAGSVVTREQLIEDVWDQNWWGPTKTLDVHIFGLRRKLVTTEGSASPISTVRGVGYRLEGPAASS